MPVTTTIQISKKLKGELDSLKDFKRQSYEEVIGKLVYIVKEDEEASLELSDEALAGVRESMEDFKKGKVYTTAQLRKELGL
ncbi:MAG: hypothetical protein V1847_03245 [Candidatus Diapherotrites archaeon]